MPATLLVKNARLSFDKNLFTPSKKGKYTTNIIVSDQTEFVRLIGGKKVAIKRADLQSILDEVLKEKFKKLPAKYENWAIRKNVNANSADSGERYDGYQDDDGIYFAPGRAAKNRPAFVRRDGSQINTTSEDGLAEAMRTFYGGCYVAAKINLGAYETTEDGVSKRGVTSFLEGLQFYRDGERFSKSEATTEGFESVPEDNDEEDL